MPAPACCRLRSGCALRAGRSRLSEQFACGVNLSDLPGVRARVADDSTRGGSFDAFVTSSSDRLMGTALLLTGERGAAEDLLQDVLERLYVAWPRVRDPLAYARRALAHGATSRWRRRARGTEVSLTGAHDPAVDDASDEAADRDRLVRALARLPARQRAVVVLRFLEDQSEAQTAATLGVSVGTVKSQTSRGLERLRHLLHEQTSARSAP